MCRVNEEEKERIKTVLVGEDTRRKCGQMVVVEIECERREEREDNNGVERKTRAKREERPVNVKEGREERLLYSSPTRREG